MENKNAPGVDSQAQSDSVSIVSDKPEDVKMRSVEEVCKEKARLEAAMLNTAPEDKFMWWQRYWAMKWFLCEEDD